MPSKQEMPVDFGKLEHPLQIFKGKEPGISFGNLISNVIALATYAAGIFFLGYLVYGGVRYVMAGGSEKAVDEAKRMITNAVIGLIIVVAAILITQLVGGILGFEDILRPKFLGPGTTCDVKEGLICAPVERCPVGCSVGQLNCPQDLFDTVCCKVTCL